MKRRGGMLFWFATLIPIVGMAQPARPPAHASTPSSVTRHFQLTMVLKFSASADGLPPPGTQSITTELAVSGDLPGSSKTRMGSQVPVAAGGKTQMIDVGTNFDCDNVHLEGDGLALHFVLEASRIGSLIRIKNAEGVEVEEPLITQRTIELSVKLPLNAPKVVFDSKVGVPGHPLQLLPPLKPLEGDAKPSLTQIPVPQPGMQVEMTAKELK